MFGFAVSFLMSLAQSPGQQSPFVTLMPFALILAIFYFIILLPMRKRKKKVDEFQADLKVGDKVVTTSGMYGVVAKMGERSVHVQVADKVHVEISRASIGGYQGEDPVVQART